MRRPRCGGEVPPARSGGAGPAAGRRRWPGWSWPSGRGRQPARLRWTPRTGFHPPIPGSLRTHIEELTPPFEVTVRIDPRWPRRSWLEGFDWAGDGDRVYWWSLIIVCLQLPVAWGLIHGSHLARDRTQPWWRLAATVSPVVVEGAALLYVAALQGPKEPTIPC